MTTRGKFIVLEGGEGSGKSACAQSLEEILGPENFFFTREPGGTSFAEDVREIFKKKRMDPTNAPEELYLILAARSHHVRYLIKPALERGLHVICDRFSASTYGYQIEAQGLAETRAFCDFFAREDERVRQGITPDLWVVLDVDPEIAPARLSAKQVHTDAFDSRGIEFHRAVRRGILEYTAHAGTRCIVDAALPEAEVLQRVLREVKKFTEV